MRVLALAIALIAPVFASFLGSRAQAVTIDWITVGAPGNVCGPQSQGCFGAVAHPYRISKYEATNNQGVLGLVVWYKAGGIQKVEVAQ